MSASFPRVSRDRERKGEGRRRSRERICGRVAGLSLSGRLVLRITSAGHRAAGVVAYRAPRRLAPTGSDPKEDARVFSLLVLAQLIFAASSPTQAMKAFVRAAPAYAFQDPGLPPQPTR
jgi:hypothetical protein